ncbi:hypothetical protein E2C01_091065 [Portunus trituberculatus]|uniref:Uncharacterized protein n=1 Tax=Portunus trituberculatus TaxID=210409 RepID=A0A5B7JRS9_PORTR|nr:hypothetical protein [Portunus trituberculatus]
MTHHTPRPSHCHEVSPLTSRGPSSSCQCLVHNVQRATRHTPATGMKGALSPLKDPPRTASVWCMAPSVPHTTPPATGMKEALSPLKDPLVLPMSGVWRPACRTPHPQPLA